MCRSKRSAQSPRRPAKIDENVLGVPDVPAIQESLDPLSGRRDQSIAGRDHGRPELHSDGRGSVRVVEARGVVVQPERTAELRSGGSPAGGDARIESLAGQQVKGGDAPSPRARARSAALYQTNAAPDASGTGRWSPPCSILSRAPRSAIASELWSPSATRNLSAAARVAAPRRTHRGRWSRRPRARSGRSNRRKTCREPETILGLSPSDDATEALQQRRGDAVEVPRASTSSDAVGVVPVLQEDTVVKKLVESPSPPCRRPDRAEALRGLRPPKASKRAVNVRDSPPGDPRGVEHGPQNRVNVVEPGPCGRVPVTCDREGDRDECRTSHGAGKLVPGLPDDNYEVRHGEAVPTTGQLIVPAITG